MNLAEDFETLIVVDQDRMRNVKAMNLKPELWTTDKNAGFINVATT